MALRRGPSTRASHTANQATLSAFGTRPSAPVGARCRGPSERPHTPQRPAPRSSVHRSFSKPITYLPPPCHRLLAPPTIHPSLFCHHHHHHRYHQTVIWSGKVNWIRFYACHRFDDDDDSFFLHPTDYSVAPSLPAAPDSAPRSSIVRRFSAISRVNRTHFNWFRLQ